MKVQSWLMFLACAGLLASLCRPTSSSADALTPASSRFVGAGSCSASNCHNGNFVHRPLAGSEYTFWITRDPHARAYEALFDDRSKRIQKNLQRSTPAHEEQRCLSCHVAPEYDAKKPPPHAPYLKRDGVSCESCHGAAREWLPLHHLEDWRSQPASAKQALGMIDTQSLGGRAQLCARCHVGAPGMDVDHDLIAAGHPRLYFELAAFHEHLPRHWPDAKDRASRPDFEARLWAVGQIVSAQAALQLLADRARDEKKPWPEFAEHDCAACHHDLGASSGAPKVEARRRTPLPWINPASLSPTAAELVHGRESATRIRTALAALESAMAKSGGSDRAKVGELSEAAAHLLNSRALERKPIHPADLPVAELLTRLLAGDRTGDGATQRDLAVAALFRAEKRDRKTVLAADLREALRRHKTTSPNNFDPAAIRMRLLELRTIEKGPAK